jgi:hypothetical protein
VKKKLTSVFLASGLGVAGCGFEAPADKPGYGIVTSIQKDSFDQYRSVYSCQPEFDVMSGNIKTVCEDRDEFARTISTRLVTFVMCRKENGVVVAASREHLKQHAQYPSDYPVVAEGETGDNVLCSTQVEVVARDMGEISIGSIVEFEQLDRITPDYYE